MNSDKKKPKTKIVFKKFDENERKLVNRKRQ